MAYTKDFHLKLFSMMFRIRTCEESFVDPILKGEIRCPVHLYTGQEAIATGVCSALEKRDYIFGNHRSHGHYLAKGGDLTAMIAEIYGRENGCSRGRGGSMHLISPENGVLGIVPIVSGTISLAMGSALASKIRNDNRVTVSFFGDGATGEGVLYESMNFASLKKLPIIFACENNLYSTHLPINEIRISKDISDIANPFNIQSYRIDGNNILTVFETANKAVEHCRKGLGPVFIEFQTYRFRGHVGPDDNVQGAHTDIRPKDELESWLNKDPIRLYKKYITENSIAKTSELDSLQKSIEQEIEDATKSALMSAEPLKEDVYKYVFKQ